ncbi:hypothetical protein [Acidovorax sp. CCYZU-2555]|uniref:hypothetical protein n=1 Tax=Acidovorax sp. CCYZU-2555 TaxID=2835042 RepID=UPI001BCAC445|nr:hypothetical protein [Acidovorax sp. CCYZU-2555]MBS7777914.1 hypothetical protein [Acidovorax sp. CCYZU-2555]
MSDISRISTSLTPNLSMSKALFGSEKSEESAKNNGKERINANNLFKGRSTALVFPFPPKNMGELLKAALQSAISHLLKRGVFSNAIKNAADFLKSDKPLKARDASVTPRPPGSWHELKTMQFELARLKDGLNFIHEQNRINFNKSTRDISDTDSIAALKVGYPKEAELKAKVEEQEKKVADFEKRLSGQKHVPDYPVRPQAPARP